MMCQPSTLCTGCEISFVLSEKAALSNGGTVGKHAPAVAPWAAQSLPPLAAEPGSFEYFLARAAKLAPFTSCALICSARFLLLTRMCRTSRVSGVENDALFLL